MQCSLIPWWSTAIPGGLLLIFVVVARISVRIMRTGLDARYREIRHGSNESTIFLSRKDFADERRRMRIRQVARPTLAAKPWHPVGSDSDHHADLCFQAAGTSDGSHDRPVRSGNVVLGTPRGTGHGRRARVGIRVTSSATQAAKRARLPLPDGGKVSVLIGPPRSAGLWRSR